MRLNETIYRRLPVQLAVLAVLAALFWLASALIGADAGLIFRNITRAGSLLGQMANPDWTYLSAVLPAIAETVQMAIGGTTIGAVLALPVSFLATTTISGSRMVTMLVRGFLNLIRTIPDVLAAALLLALFGIGPFTGMIAIAVFTFGFISKLFYESIDTVNFGPIESLFAVGARRAEVGRYAILPQIAPNIFSYSLFVLEINVRSSIVLGLVGAGGIGVPLRAVMDLGAYNRVIVIILAIFAVVLVIDTLSTWARRKYL